MEQKNWWPKNWHIVHVGHLDSKWPWECFLLEWYIGKTNTRDEKGIISMIVSNI